MKTKMMRKIDMKYANGEGVTKELIQDEPWYPQFQAMLQVHVYGRESFDAWQDLVQAFKIDWEDNGISDERLELWAKCCLRPGGGCMLKEGE
jgi:hypothetical protein